jgi:membrane-associated phospholipid phosphatase
MKKKYLAPLSLADSTTILFLSFLSVIALIFCPRIPGWWWILSVNTALSALIAWSASRCAFRPSRAIQFFHDWYSVPIIFYSFKLTYIMIHPIQPQDYDWLFISVDRWLFGVDPTQWLAQYSHPIVTEILQLGYASYYFILLAVLVELHRTKRFPEFQNGLFLMVFGIYLSFIGYFVLPGVGPRFTLHDFALLETELPGIFLTAPLRDILNAGESIQSGVSNAIDIAQRDIFPSGHTQLTLVALYLAFRHTLRSRWVLLVLGVLLLIATVYLRYHYVVDVIGGIAFCFITIWGGMRIERWWRRRNREHVTGAVNTSS